MHGWDRPLLIFTYPDSDCDTFALAMGVWRGSHLSAAVRAPAPGSAAPSPWSATARSSRTAGRAAPGSDLPRTCDFGVAVATFAQSYCSCNVCLVFCFFVVVYCFVLFFFGGGGGADELWILPKVKVLDNASVQSTTSKATAVFGGGGSKDSGGSVWVVGRWRRQRKSSWNRGVLGCCNANEMNLRYMVRGHDSLQEGTLKASCLECV